MTANCSRRHRHAQEISVRIDGELCRASEGQTILDVARANKKYIPTLCFLEGLTPSGSCRLCLVEVAGVGRLLPACTTPIQNGMSVNTNSEKLLRHRQMAMEFLLLERNHYCAICVCNNHCELQAMAQRLGRDARPLSLQLSPAACGCFASSATFWTTTAAFCAPAACGCARRWRGQTFGKSAGGASIRAWWRSLNGPWGESKSCTKCGKCVQVCPTGALAEKGLAVEEMTKSNENIKWLAVKRGVHALT